MKPQETGARVVGLRQTLGHRVSSRVSGLSLWSCGLGCDLALHVQDNETVKVTSAHDNPVTHGNLRIKGRFGYQHVQNRG